MKNLNGLNVNTISTQPLIKGDKMKQEALKLREIDYHYGALGIASNSITYGMPDFHIVKEDPSISDEYKERLSKIRHKVNKGKHVDVGDVEDFARRYGL